MKRLFSTILIFLMSSTLSAVPASPEPALIRYLDGRTLTVTLRGDETRSWHETEDGLHVMKNASGIFEYVQAAKDGTIKTSGVRAHAPAERSKEERTYISTLPEKIVYPASVPPPTVLQAPADGPFDQTDFPTLGAKKFLLILAQFTDVTFTHRPDDFDSLMNAKDYTYNSAYGSVNAYYKATSFDRFDPHFDVVGPVTLSQGYAYYGANDDGNIQQFVAEAITLADPLVNYAEYDNDDDGTVDNIYIIYAGYGECFSGADPNTIWPHRSAYYTGTLYKDGKYFWDYSTSMEFYGTSGTTRTSIGVVCHEFGHVCGLPDFYDTDYGESGGDCGGLGSWDAMAGGSWNDAGKRPPLFNAWSRMYLKWAEPLELGGVSHVTLNPAHSHNETRYFFSSTSDEFFMMENRQKVGWDAAIPGHGLLIFHVDSQYGNAWNNNSLNCNPYHQAFDLEEADGLGNITGSYINSGDPFPGSTGKTEFLDSGTPNALDWAGQPSRSPIRNIAENAGVISFNFGDTRVEAPANIEATAFGYDSVRISWSLNSTADSVIMIWSTSNGIGYPDNLTQYRVGESAAGGTVIYKGIDSVLYHTGLAPGTTHYYSLFAFNDSAYTYSDKISASAVTASPPFYATDFADGLPEGWIIFDRYGTGTFSTENPENRTFGASTAGNGFMIMDSEHAGAVSLIDAELITQSYNFGLSRSVLLHFEHKLEITAITLARILYTVNNGTTWYEARRWTANTADPEIVDIDLSAEVAGFRDVKFKFNYRGTNEKYWCIDDFQISSALDTGLAAGFHTARTAGSKPLTVHFMNTTVSKPDTADTYIWEFGDDGNFYYDKEPVHTYLSSGIYSVSLTVNKGESQSLCSKENYIRVVNDAPVAAGDRDTLDVRKNAATVFDLNTLFSDPNGDPLTFSWSGNSENLSITAQSDSLVEIRPAADYLGTETVTFVAEDNEGDTVSRALDIWVSETGIDIGVPAEFICEQNYPNPFNPATTIRYQLPESRKVSLTVYSLNGSPVRTLVEGVQEAGYYTVRFTAAGLPSGVYLYRLVAGKDGMTKKMILMK
ncbi:MAG: M6 family metalloprotease domain-containing protein [Candidatus Marinimicrobia bacterium]|nr:M6 family metalloprotease domain-containing protein [Candidatus Neomarinimicrobiota bacterium]